MARADRGVSPPKRSVTILYLGSNLQITISSPASPQFRIFGGKDMLPLLQVPRHGAGIKTEQPCIYYLIIVPTSRHVRSGFEYIRTCPEKPVAIGLLIASVFIPPALRPVCQAIIAFGDGWSPLREAASSFAHRATVDKTGGRPSFVCGRYVPVAPIFPFLR